MPLRTRRDIKTWFASIKAEELECSAWSTDLTNALVAEWVNPKSHAPKLRGKPSQRRSLLQQMGN